MVKIKIFGQTDMYDNLVENGAGKGIHFIANGWVLSAQAGWGNYCSEDPNRNNEKLTSDTIRTDCEIALWKEGNFDMLKFDSDSVMGWVKWDMVFDIIQWLREQKETSTEKQVRNKVLDLKKNYDTEGVK